jgi:hypothetical protein
MVHVQVTDLAVVVVTEMVMFMVLVLDGVLGMVPATVMIKGTIKYE